MRFMIREPFLRGVVLLTLLVPSPSAAQSVRPAASNIVLPQRRAFPLDRRGSVEITGVKAGVVVVEGAATTTMDIDLRNPGRVRLEAELLVPVPDGCVVRGFSFQGASKEPTARLLPRDEARRIYESIVRRVRDPALLEFAGYNLIRTSVFPVEAGGTQRVRLTYEHILEVDGNRVDFVLPRSESLDYRVPWNVSVKVRSRRPVSTVYSPSHDIETERRAPGEVTVRIRPEARTRPGAFRLSYLLEEKDISASLLAYPDPTKGGGYFLLLAGLPVTKKQEPARTIRREVTLVLDRSGSMNGGKLAQVREAALQIIAGLEEGEAFNIIVYNEAVELFSPRPVLRNEASERRAREYLESVRARGGTNIHDALIEALRQKPSEGTLPIVLFLTDGLPTIGQTSEVAIRDVAIKGNPYSRRVFTFGVGVDVNTPLLERIASVTRSVATFVLPKEDVELKVARVFRRLSGPVLASPELRVLDGEGKPVTDRVRDLAPPRLPDLFDGDQLVLLGTYRGEEPLRFALSGNYRGRERSFRFEFPLDSATTRNAFVPRLWASRTIGYLEDAIRDLGAGTGFPGAPGPSPDDPRLKELVDEIVRLSTEFGILSEYTAFLAREGTDLSEKDKVLAEAGGNYWRRALRTRSGVGSVNQDLNRQNQKARKTLNNDNSFWDRNMNRVSVSGVQQVADKAFFLRGGRWVDSRVVDREDRVRPKRIVEFSSPEFLELLRRLAKDGRQGFVSLRGDILMEIDGEPIMVKGPSGPSGR